MKEKPRKKHSPAFKAKVALVALTGDKTLSQLTHLLGSSKSDRRLEEAAERARRLGVWEVRGEGVFPKITLSGPPLRIKRWMAQRGGQSGKFFEGNRL